MGAADGDAVTVITWGKRIPQQNILAKWTDKALNIGKAQEKDAR